MKEILMFVDSVVYLIQSYWFVVIVVLAVGLLAGWKSYIPNQG